MDALETLNYNLMLNGGVANPPKGAPEPTVGITRQIVTGIGEAAEIPLRDIVKRRETNVKFRLSTFVYMSFSVGNGFYNTANTETPTGRKCLDIVNDFVEEEFDLDTINQLIALDVWASGNAFINTVGTEKEPLQAMYYTPLSSIIRINRESNGKVLDYVQSWGGLIDRRFAPEEIAHFRWLPSDQRAFGEGLGQILERRGVGYKSNSGNTITRPSMFEIDEMLEDTSAKMIYAGLPRFHASFPGSKDGAQAPQDYIDNVVTPGLNKLDPLQHFATNVQGEIKTISLDTQNKFDSFIRRSDDEMLHGIMSPIPRLWSSLNFSFASSKEAVDAMLPLIKVYQRAHKRFIENRFYKTLILQAGKDPKKANVRLNWGQVDPLEVGEIREVFDMLKEPQFIDKFDPNDFITMLIEAGVQLTPPVKERATETAQTQINQLREYVGISDNKSKIRELSQLQYIKKKLPKRPVYS